MEHVEEKGLYDIITMMAHGQGGILIFARMVKELGAAAAGTLETDIFHLSPADRLCIGSPGGGKNCAVQALPLESGPHPAGNRSGSVPVRLHINMDRMHDIADGGAGLPGLQDMGKNQGVNSPGNPDQHPVSIGEHSEISHGPTDFSPTGTGYHIS